MTKLFFVRHAESIANTEDVYQGQSYDTSLSLRGIEQASAVGWYLKDIEISSIITSPLICSQMTARAIGIYHPNVEININQQISEINQGLWEGKNKMWIQRAYGSLYDKWLGEPSKVVFPSGEHFTKVMERVKKFSQTPFEGNTVIVSHDNIIRVALCYLQGIDISKMWKIRLDSVGITQLDIDSKSGFPLSDCDTNSISYNLIYG